MSDAIIVLGRGIREDGSLPDDPKARVRKSVELYNQGVAPLIVMSGAWTYHLDINPTRSEAAAMKEYAVELGVPSNAIIEESKSLDTIGNVYFTKKDIVEPRGFHAISVVASEEHMPRVQYLFEKIYGPGYTIEFIVSERVIGDESYEKEQAHEQNSMGITRQWLDSLPAGDDAALGELLITKHPAYMPDNLKSRSAFVDGDLYPDAP